MGKVLNIHNAKLKTASVEIKTLTIEGKQVTLAVFRQLEIKPLINKEKGFLNGIPWGRVNYHPDGCKDTFKDHYHIIWQAGTELFRDNIPYLGGLDHIFASHYPGTEQFFGNGYNQGKANLGEEFIRRENIRKHVKAISELPQIFIAV